MFLASSKASSSQSEISASSINFQYPVVSLRSSSSCLRLLLCLAVTYIPPFFFSIMCVRRQFLRKMCQIQLAFLLFIASRILLPSLTQCNTFSFLTRSVQIIFSILFQHYISKLFRYSDLLFKVSIFQHHTMI
jgi:hypothetical protein